MVLQGLAPGMEDGGHAELGTEMLGVGRDGGECLGRAAEQDGIDDGFVLEGNLSGGRRQGEDDVEIRHGKESACRLASHCARAEPWHFGQCRLRQKLWGERRGREMVHRRSMKRMEVPHEPSQ